MSRPEKATWHSSPPDPEVWWHCNRNRPAVSYRRKPGGNLRFVGKPIVSPRICRIRVSAQLPKPQNISIQEGDLPDELRPFPGIPLRNNHPDRATVIE